MSRSKHSILCVANWESDVGYAWWLMESYWVEISRHFSESYHTLIAFPKITTIPATIQNSSVESLEYDFTESSFAKIFANAKLLKKYNVKILYFSDRPMSSFAYVIYRLAGVETIISHDHTPGLRTKATGVKRFLKTIKVNLPFISVDGGFGATDFVTRRLKETNCLKPEKCFSIQNGIKPFETLSKGNVKWSSLNIPDDTKLIATAARANSYKGIDFALDVVEKLVEDEKVGNFGYILFGDGPDLDRFKVKAAELGISDYCFFPGRIDNASKLLGNCYVGFQPSLGEVGYSLSILEYMYAKLPVVVPDNPSVCDATDDGHNGAVYADGDVSSAAKAISSYLLSPSMQAEHGNNAKLKVEQNYTLIRTHKALTTAIEAVIKD